MENEKMYDEVPSLDLNDFTNGSKEQKQKFISDLGQAYNNIGFVAIKNHGLTDKMVDDLYSTIKEFFSLSDEVKKKYENLELKGQRGYISKNKEKAKDSNVSDLKEFYHVGQDTEKYSNYPDNIFPEEVENFKEITTSVYSILENTGLEMLRAIALYLNLEENYFDDKVRGGDSVLRPIHYFPIENPDSLPEGAVRAAEHGDINLITLLMGASADGLQVKRRDGVWIPITALPDQIVVNVGDMLDRLTNNKLKSTIHRVVNPPKEQMKNSRYSIPFFMHPVSNMDLTCLNDCVSINQPKMYEDTTAGNFLQERLKELGF